MHQYSNQASDLWCSDDASPLSMTPLPFRPIPRRVLISKPEGCTKTRTAILWHRLECRQRLYVRGSTRGALKLYHVMFWSALWSALVHIPLVPYSLSKMNSPHRQMQTHALQACAMHPSLITYVIIEIQDARTMLTKGQPKTTPRAVSNV